MKPSKRITPRPPRPPRVFSEYALARYFRCRRDDLAGLVRRAGIPFIQTPQGARFELLDVARALGSYVNAEDARP